MVTASGFSSTPLTRALILSIILTSILVSTLDIKHHFPIKPTPHLWPYLQFTRLLTFQLAYISSTELLFAVALLYQMRVLERLWGTRKYGSFIVVVWSLCAVGIAVLGVVLKLVTWGAWGYIPPGVTGLCMAAISVWRGEVPGLYGFRVVTGIGEETSTSTGRAPPGQNASGGATAASSAGEATEGNASQSPGQIEKGILLSDKFTTYLLVLQLSMSQFPYQILPAIVGWIIGVAWREELLPMGLIRWRIPGWMVGETSDGKRSQGQYEGLRRRLEEEGGARDGMREVSDGVAAGGSSSGEGTQGQRRGIGRGIMGYFTGS